MNSGPFDEPLLLRDAIEADRDQLALHSSAIPFLGYPFYVAVRGSVVVGYLAWQRTAPDECEVLQLEVLPEFRRQGVASQLLSEFLKQSYSNVFLEVRTSNLQALQLYEKLGFTKIGIRRNYYSHPTEDGIVLAFHPC